MAFSVARAALKKAGIPTFVDKNGIRIMVKVGELTPTMTDNLRSVAIMLVGTCSDGPRGTLLVVKNIGSVC